MTRPAAANEPVSRWVWTSRAMLNIASGSRATIESESMLAMLRSTGADTSATCDAVDGTSHSVELLLSVDRDGPHTLGAQVEEQLRSAIRSGALRPGTEIPSTRDLARQLGISRRVAVEAYAQLAAEGYLAVRQGARPRVAAAASAYAPRSADAGGGDDATATAATRAARRRRQAAARQRAATARQAAARQRAPTARRVTARPPAARRAVTRPPVGRSAAAPPAHTSWCRPALPPARLSAARRASTFDPASPTSPPSRARRG